MATKEKNSLKILAVVVLFFGYYYYAVQYEKGVAEGEKLFDAKAEMYFDSVGKYDSLKRMERIKKQIIDLQNN